MTVLHQQLSEAITRRRAVAVAASTCDRGVTSTGEHWYWECPHHPDGVEVSITDVVLLDEMVSCPESTCGSLAGWMISREKYKYPNQPKWEPRSHLVLSVEELSPSVALHVQINDPAFVIRQCDFDLRVLSRHWNNLGPRRGACEACWQVTSNYTAGVEWPCDEIKWLAEVYEIDVKQ